MTELDGTTAALRLFSPEVAADPHEAYAQLRNECPVARGDLGDHSVVLLSRYDDVLWALRHPEPFTSAGGNLNLGEQPLLPLEVDPPQHTAYRRILNPQFVPREIDKLEPAVRKLVGELLDTFVAKGECDFHEDFATPLPSGIFLALMGLPTSDLPMFLAVARQHDPPRRRAGRLRGRRRGSATRRPTPSATTSGRASPRCEPSPNDTLLSNIVHAEVDGEPLTETELLGISHLLLLGGLDTVTATLDCMVAFLATPPRAPPQLVDDPSPHPGRDRGAAALAEPGDGGAPHGATRTSRCTTSRSRRATASRWCIGAANGDDAEFGAPRGGLRPRAQQARRLRRRPPPLPRRAPRPARAAGRARGAPRPHPRLRASPPAPSCSTPPASARPSAFPSCGTRRDATAARGALPDRVGRRPPDRAARPLRRPHARAPRRPRAADRATPTTADRSWTYEGNVYPNIGLNAVVGRPREEWSMEPADFDEMRRGCWDIDARIEDMDLAGIGASVCFPSLIAGFCRLGVLRSRRTPSSAWPACGRGTTGTTRCGPAPTPAASSRRRSPGCTTRRSPPTMVRANAARGFRALSFAEMPAKLGLPSLHTGHWDPLLAACEETETVVCLHTGSSAWIAAALRRPALRAAAHAVPGERLRRHGRLAVVGRVHALPAPADRACPRAASAG